MIAITRMRSSFLKTSSKENLLASPPPSPEKPAVISEDGESEDAKLSTPTKVLAENDNSGFSPSQSPLVITTYEEAISPGDCLESATPTNNNIFSYPTTRDRKFVESETAGSEEYTASPQVSPPSGSDTEKDQLSDTTKDSGYEGRKSTREIMPDVEESDTEDTIRQPTFTQHLPAEMDVIEGDCARLEAVVEGVPTPNMFWFKDSAPMVFSDRVEIESGGTKHALIIRDITLRDDAEYECRAVSDHGESSSFCELLVVSNK